MKQVNFKRCHSRRTTVRMLLLLTILCFNLTIQAQVTIGTNEPPKSYSILEVVSDTSNIGGLRLPQLTDTDKAAIETTLTADPANSKGF